MVFTYFFTSYLYSLAVNIFPFQESIHGAPKNDGMTLNRWLDSHKDDAQSESMDWETSVSDN
jgi:hypothetical protein